MTADTPTMLTALYGSWASGFLWATTLIVATTPIEGAPIFAGAAAAFTTLMAGFFATGVIA